jgi:hypothetical protein
MVPTVERARAFVHVLGTTNARDLAVLFTEAWGRWYPRSENPDLEHPVFVWKRREKQLQWKKDRKSNSRSFDSLRSLRMTATWGGYDRICPIDAATFEDAACRQGYL